MKYKKIAKKNRLNKQIIRDDENASIHSQESEGEELELENEILEKLREEHQLFDDEEMGDVDMPKNESEDDEEVEEHEESGFALNTLDLRLKDLFIELNNIEGYKKVRDALSLAISFYFYKRAKGERIDNHPVIKSISQLEEIYKRLQLNNKFTEKQVTEEVTTEEVAVQNNKEKPRLINRMMYRNRGIPTLRNAKKSAKNPRLKQKERFRKAKMKVKSKGLNKVAKGNATYYDGEENGIRIGLNRTTDIN